MLKIKEIKFTCNVIHGKVNDWEAHLLKEPPQCHKTMMDSLKVWDGNPQNHPMQRLSEGQVGPSDRVGSPGLHPGRPPSSPVLPDPCGPPLWTSRASLYDTSAKAWSGDRFSSFNTLARPPIPVLLLHSSPTRKQTCKTIRCAGRTSEILWFSSFLPFGGVVVAVGGLIVRLGSIWAVIWSESLWNEVTDMT